MTAPAPRVISEYQQMTAGLDHARRDGDRWIPAPTGALARLLARVAGRLGRM